MPQCLLRPPFACAPPMAKDRRRRGDRADRRQIPVLVWTAPIPPPPLGNHSVGSPADAPQHRPPLIRSPLPPYQLSSVGATPEVSCSCQLRVRKAGDFENYL